MKFEVRTGKSSLTQSYIGQVYRDGVLVWQTKGHYDTPDEARRIAGYARIRLEEINKGA